MKYYKLQLKNITRSEQKILDKWNIKPICVEYCKNF